MWGGETIPGSGHFNQERPIHPADVFPAGHPALTVPKNVAGGLFAGANVPEDDAFTNRFYTNAQLARGLWGYEADYQTINQHGAQVFYAYNFGFMLSPNFFVYTGPNTDTFPAAPAYAQQTWNMVSLFAVRLYYTCYDTILPLYY